MLTGAKKLVSNWSLTNASVREDWCNSSIVPINASDLQTSRMSMRSNAARASAMADWHCPIFLSKHLSHLSTYL